MRIGLAGYGRIGQAVLTTIDRERGRLAAMGLALEGAAALVRDPARARPNAVSVRLVTDRRDLFGQDLDVLVEVLGGIEPARTLVTHALQHGIPVVTANKSLVAAHGGELRALAAEQRTPLLFEAAVVAGVPFLGALSRRPLFSSISSLLGVVNGTTHVVTSAIARGERFDDALQHAVACGYAEPDSDADVSGRDAAEKLAVLLQLAGCRGVAVADLPRLGIEWLTPAHFAGARACGGTIKPIVWASLDEANRGAWIGPAFVAADHPIANISGVTNALQFQGSHGRASLFIGPGAGPEVTAATIVDDIVEAVRAYDLGSRFAGMQGGSDLRGRVLTEWCSTPPRTSSFLCVAPAGRLRLQDVAELLAAYRVPARQIVERDGMLAARLAEAPWASVIEAVAQLNGRGVHAMALPALFPERRW